MLEAGSNPLSVRRETAFELRRDRAPRLLSFGDGTEEGRHDSGPKPRNTLKTTLQFLPPPDFEAQTLADFMVLGHIMTAMPAINAIAAVVAAPAGIVSYPDVRLPLPRGLVRL